MNNFLNKLTFTLSIIAIISIIIAAFIILRLYKSTHDYTPCGHTWQAQRMAYILTNNIKQQRKEMKCDLLLVNIADWRAHDLSTYVFDSNPHRSSDGRMTNKVAIDMGYKLPPSYSEYFNNIESVAWGYDNPEDTMTAFYFSQRHFVHVYGIASFHKTHDCYGTGFYYNENSEYKYYWAIITAPCQE